jgi:hypothetical protein
MDSLALLHQASRRRPARRPRIVAPGWLVAAMACALAVLLWSLPSPAPQDAPTGHTAPAASRYAADIGDLVRWHGADGVERLLVANGERNAVVVYDATTGQPLATTAPGRFTGISGLSVDANRLFVSERGKRRIQVLSLPDLGTQAILTSDAAPARDPGTELASIAR